VQAVTIGLHEDVAGHSNRPAKIHPSATGSERSSPTVSGWSAINDQSIGEGWTMEMRIVVPDATSASALAERLTVAFGARRISRLDDRPEVGVQVGRHSDRAVLRVLDAVEGWLDHAGAGFAELRLGKRSYRFTR
jgi:hypothetical protein